SHALPLPSSPNKSRGSPAIPNFEARWGKPPSSWSTGRLARVIGMPRRSSPPAKWNSNDGQSSRLVKKLTQKAKRRERLAQYNLAFATHPVIQGSRVNLSEVDLP